MARLQKSLTAQYQYVCINDDAFLSGGVDDEGNDDPERASFRAIWEEAIASGDISALPVKDGQSPLLWTLRRMRSRHMRLVQEEIGQSKIGFVAMYTAARLSIVGVKGLADDEGDFTIARAQDARLDAMCVTRDCMDDLGAIVSADGEPLGETLINEIALYVMSGGGADQGK